MRPMRNTKKNWTVTSLPERTGPTLNARLPRTTLTSKMKKMEAGEGGSRRAKYQASTSEQKSLFHLSRKHLKINQNGPAYPFLIVIDFTGSY